jgi:hypothetical protein
MRRQETKFKIKFRQTIQLESKLKTFLNMKRKKSFTVRTYTYVGSGQAMETLILT